MKTDSFDGFGTTATSQLLSREYSFTDGKRGSAKIRDSFSEAMRRDLSKVTNKAMVLYG